MGRRTKPVRYPITRTVQQMTRQICIGLASYTEFRILPAIRPFGDTTKTMSDSTHRCQTGHPPKRVVRLSNLTPPRTTTAQNETEDYEIQLRKLSF
jgi:hypothetical protein